MNKKLLAFVWMLFFSLAGVYAATFFYSDTFISFPGQSQTLQVIPSDLTATTPNQTWLDFDGVNDEVSVSKPNYLNISNPFTITAWIKTGTLKGTGDDGDIVTIWNAAGNQRGFALSINNNKLKFITSTDGGGTLLNNSIGSTSIGNDSDWIHVAGRFNGTSLEVFLNGSSDDSTPNGAIVFNSNQTIEIAVSRQYGWFNGSIADVRMFNRSLENNEIDQLYKRGWPIQWDGVI